MRKTINVVLAVLLGLVAWLVVATLGNFVIRAVVPGYAEVERAMTFTLPMQIARLVVGAVSSTVAGAACALAFRNVPAGVGILAAALVVVFLPVHYGLRAQFPIWYHVIFLASLAPCVLLGAWLARRWPARRVE